MRAAVGALLLACWAACGGDGEGTAPPSIILISLDTLRADHVGFLGYRRDTTPFLDRLAAESIVFERAYATSHWTLISHMSMLSGLYPEQHGVVAEDAALGPDVPLLAERLGDRGYRSIALYFPGWIHARHGFDRGFDVFRPHHDGGEAGEHLEQAFADLGDRRPFFLFLHLFDVHCGNLDRGDRPLYEAPAPFDEVFLPGARERLAGIDCRACWETPGLLSPEQLEALVAMYDGGIRHVDAMLEGWIEGWRRAGILDEAILIVTADHGEALGQRDGRVDGHGGMFEEGLRVPLLLRLPGGARGGERVVDPVSLVDVVPTVLSLLGSKDERLAGYGLLGRRPEGSIVLAQQGGVEVLVRWPWKFAEVDGGGLYTNLEDDPLELQPVAVEGAELERIRSELHGLLRAEHGAGLVRFEPGRAGGLDAAEEAALRALGYGGEEPSDG